MRSLSKILERISPTANLDPHGHRGGGEERLDGVRAVAGAAAVGRVADGEVVPLARPPRAPDAARGPIHVAAHHPHGAQHPLGGHCAPQLPRRVGAPQPQAVVRA